MAKPIMVQCIHCTKQIERDSAYKVGTRRYFCNETCFNNHEEKIKNKSKKKNYKPKEGTDRRDLTDYIQKIYMENGYKKERIPWQMIMSQVSNILAEHEVWNYITIQYILWYMYEIEEINLFGEDSKGSIVNLVPYYGSQAEDYFRQCQEIEQAVEAFDFTPTVVTIKKNKHQSKVKPLTFD